jgi:hypothetical protein
MNRFLFFSVLVATLILFPGQGSADNAPHKIGGFTLGEQISTFVDLVRMKSAMPIRDQQYLRIVEIGNLEGYKSGNIAFGNCARPGQIVRIKFKKRFGEPDEWRGDPFHVIVAWKWSFKDKGNNKISLILQYSRDEDYKWGNSVKLTNTTLVEQERTCYQKKHPGKSGSQEGKKSAKRRELKAEDYQRFVPE